MLAALDRGGPLGRVRRLRRTNLASRITDAPPQGGPLRLVRHRGGSSRPVQAAARQGHRARVGQARLLHRAPAAAGEGDAPGRGQDHHSTEAWPARRPPTAYRYPRPIRSTSSIPPARPASQGHRPRQPAAISSPSPGALRKIYGVEPGEVYWAASISAGRWATPTSSTARSSTGTRPCSMKESRSALPIPAPSGESSRATTCGRSSRREQGVPRHPARPSTPQASTSAATT